MKKLMLAQVAVAAGVLTLVAAPSAHATVDEGAAGVVFTTEGSGDHSVTGQCSFGAMLPGTQFDTIGVAYDAAAHATGVAISTSVICTLRPAPGSTTSYGSIGITLVGADAAIAGTAEVPRLAPALYGCVKVNAAFLDGESATQKPTERCDKL